MPVPFKDYFRESKAVFTEGKENGPSKVSGIAGKANIMNKNDRFYSQNTYVQAVEKAQEKIQSGSLLGEVDHPEWGSGSLKESAVKFTRVWIDEDLMRYDAEILPTPAGDLLKKLFLAEVGMSNSTRGIGKAEYKELDDGTEMEIVKDYELLGIDFVIEGSNPYGKPTKWENVVKKYIKEALEEKAENNKKEKKEEQKMTLEELKAKYPELVKTLSEEAEKKVTESFNENLSKVREEAEKEALQKEDVKKVFETFENVKKTFAPHFTFEKGSEELQKELETVKTEGKVYKEELEKVKKELNTYKESEKKRQVEVDRVKAIEEAIKDYKYFDHLKTVLEDYKTAEEVKANVEKKKGFIEKLLGELKGDIPSKEDVKNTTEQGEVKNEDKQEASMSKQMLEWRKLAGLEEKDEEKK